MFCYYHSYPNHLQVDAGGWTEQRRDRNVVGSKLLLEGLDALGLEFANVSGRDLILGSEAIQQLHDGNGDAAGLRLLAANIRVDGEVFFTTHAIVERKIDGRSVRIGITGEKTAVQ